MIESVRGPSPEATRARFDGIAGGYDRANTVLSLGIHHSWRRRVVREAGLVAGARVLDCATGTGDLALALAAALGGRGEVVGIDLSSRMLAVAREKAVRRGLPVTWHEADVTRLPFADGSFDVVTIAFGIRNVADPAAGLAELARVTRPGGRVLVLEFGQPGVPVFRECFALFSRHVLPRVGKWIAGDRAAYEYLVDSSAAFPSGDRFLSLARRAAPFSETASLALTGGLVYLYRLVPAERLSPIVPRNP